MTQSVMVNLSDTVILHLKQVATLSKQSLEQVIRQSIEGNLPPEVPSTIPELRAELLRMQNMPGAELRAIAIHEIPLAEQQRHMELLEQNSAGTISEEGRSELQKHRLKADEVMLSKAYAWALLRWRGFPLPQPN